MSHIYRKEHIDGEWITSDHQYNDRKLTIKMRKGSGAKIHIWNIDKNSVIKTFRYNYATEDFLIAKAKKYIDNKS